MPAQLVVLAQLAQLALLAWLARLVLGKLGSLDSMEMLGACTPDMRRLDRQDIDDTQSAMPWAQTLLPSAASVVLWHMWWAPVDAPVVQQVVDFQALELEMRHPSSCGCVGQKLGVPQVYAHEGHLDFPGNCGTR